MSCCFIKLSNNFYKVNDENGDLHRIESYISAKRVNKYNKECQNVVFAFSPFNRMPDHILDKIASNLPFPEDFKICVPYFNYKITSHPLCRICGKCVNHICKCKVLKYCESCKKLINGFSIYYRMGRPFCKSCGWKMNILISKTKALSEYCVPEAELIKLPFFEKNCQNYWVTLYERRLIEKIAVPYLQKKEAKKLRLQNLKNLKKEKTMRWLAYKQICSEIKSLSTKKI